MDGEFFDRTTLGFCLGKTYLSCILLKPRCYCIFHSQLLLPINSKFLATAINSKVAHLLRFSLLFSLPPSLSGILTICRLIWHFVSFRYLNIPSPPLSFHHHFDHHSTSSHSEPHYANASFLIAESGSYYWRDRIN